MRRFLFESVDIFILIVMVHGLTAICFADGMIDSYYLRFTTPAQTRIFFGNSRIAQGIVPHIFDLELESPESSFNFAFTINRAPYGPYYFSAIQKKISKNCTDGLFILGIDPWGISTSKENINDSAFEFREAETIPYLISNPNQSVNFDYLLNFYYTGWGKMILDHLFFTRKTLLHSDGWLEVLLQEDTTAARARKEELLKVYSDYARDMKLSTTRCRSLEEIIHYLKNRGQVLLVRMPVDNRVKELEDRYMPELDTIINGISKRNKVVYIDFTGMDDRFFYHDGNHLSRYSAKEFTKILADSVYQGLIKNNLPAD